MAMMPQKPRRGISAVDAAEAVFKPAVPQVETAPKSHVVPTGKELVSLRLDRDVLEHFQDEGPGWQERINEALRKVAGL
jgi:uncharacterized protein (DUF4415 family)